MGVNMIKRALLLALSCAYAAGVVAPALVPQSDEECALYLRGPPRSSAYDYSLNLLKGNFGYEGQHSCITYEAINQAYLEARQRIVVAQPKGEWKPEDYASVGELVLDISINLARTYGLTYEEIEKGLPLIDTSRTLIREVCPPVFSHVECRPGKYRRLDGLCNNLQHPTWGSINAPFQRLIGPLFADGINAPRISHTGRDLPLSRVVSRTMHPDEGFHDHAGTVMVIAWGQFMDHDYTLTGTPLDPRNRNDPEECCKRPPHQKHPYCNEIRIPDDDYFYRLFGVKCIDFVRSFPSPRPGCRLGSRVPFNTLTGALDGNTVYGVTDKFARKLRTGYGGLLRMNPVFQEYGLKDLLPLKLDIPDEGCTRPNKNMYCFEAGEIRVNEQLVLTVMHTLMAREHNRVAKGLAAVNPHWDDETLYQEARRINIAEIQHITYNEFLPILLGKDVMEKFGLVLEKEGYWDGYDPNVNPDVIDAFAAAAYRFGHSLLPTAVERWSKAHKFIASKRLSDLIRRPYDLYRAGVLDEYIMGLMNQVAQAMDDSITQEVTNHLFKKVGARFGMDLVSFNMQRGREFGIPGYMEFRKFCGLSGADTFQGLFGAMPNETIRKYESIFEHPIDVDLWSGGVSERALPGSMLGPTFACIIATQFSYSRRGDRFWYELPNQPSSFTPEQLVEVRKARLARVICDNTDIIDTVQLYPMVLADHELNPRVPCRSGIIPSMDFSKWAESPPAFHSAKSFMTHAYIPVKNESGSQDSTNVEVNYDNTTTDNILANVSLAIQDNSSRTIETDEKLIENINLLIKAELLKEGNITFNHNNTESNCTESNNCVHNTVNDTRPPNNISNVLKNINENILQKTTGNPKNSIHRRRRYAKSPRDRLRYAASAPLIVNYETAHASDKREPLSFSPNRGVIQNSQLADFNIETVHTPPRRNGAETNPNFQVNNEYQNQYGAVHYPPIPNVQSRKNVRTYDDDENDNKNKTPKESNESRDTSSDEEKKPLTDNTENEKLQKNYVQSRENAEEDNDDSSESGERVGDGEKAQYRNRDESVRNDYRASDESSERRDTSKEDERVNSEESDENDRGKSNYREKDTSKERDNSREKHSSKEYSNSHERYNDNRDNYDKDKRAHYRDRNESIEKSNYKEEPRRSQDDYSKEDDYPSSSSEKGVLPHKATYNSNEVDQSSEKDTISNSKEDYAAKNKERHSFPPKDSNENSHDVSASESNESAEDNDDKNSSSDNTRPKLKNKSETYRDNISRNPTPTNNEDDEEEAIIIMTKKIKKPNARISINSPVKIPDVEKYNAGKGFVKPVTYSYETFNGVPTAQLVSQPTIKPFASVVTGPPLISQIIESVRHPTGNPVILNDGEVRPVIELHGDKEESRDKNSKEDLKSNPEDQSLESILGVTETIEQAGKIIKETVADAEDVKQQFERIPLNYNHNLKEGNHKLNQANDSDGPIITSDIETEVPLGAPAAQKDEDASSPTSDPSPELSPINYNENIKLKFDLEPLKLPEIKLPDDILSYVYEEPAYVKKDKQNKFFHYDDVYDREDPRHEKRQKLKHPDHHDDYHGDDESHHGEAKEKENYKETEKGHDEDHDNQEHYFKPPPLSYYRYPKYPNEDESQSDDGAVKEKENYKKSKKDEDHDHDNDGDDYDHYYKPPKGFYNYPKVHDDYKEEKKQGNDDEEDLYEKFVRERFGKRGSFEERAESLHDTRPVASDPKLYSRLRQVLKKAEDIEKEAVKSGDPNAGYLWTLEYGQNL